MKWFVLGALSVLGPGLLIYAAIKNHRRFDQ